jgi:Rrf2 family protein
MLKLSNKERYAMQALFDLAFHARGGEPTQIKDIALRQRIPMRFLEQIFQDLKRAGLVASKRGPRGGYQLARAAKDVVLGDVLRAVSGPLVLAAGTAPKAKRGSARPSRRSPEPTLELREVTDVVLQELSSSIQRCFDGVTLEDVCTRGRELGLARPERHVGNYVI